MWPCEQLFPDKSFAFLFDISLLDESRNQNQHIDPENEDLAHKSDKTACFSYLCFHSKILIVSTFCLKIFTFKSKTSRPKKIVLGTDLLFYLSCFRQYTSHILFRVLFSHNCFCTKNRVSNTSNYPR